MKDHYSADDLLATLDAPSEVVQKHLSQCLECTAIREHLQEFERTLADPAAWMMAESLGTPAASLPAALRNRVEAIDQTAVDASELLAPILVSLSAFKNAEIEHLRQYRNPAVVRALCSAAKQIRDREPQFALLLATTATEICARLQRAESRDLGVEASAWLEVGIVSTVLGKYRDGDRALMRAEDAYRIDNASTKWNFANVWLTRANIYVETERLDDALELAGVAAEAYFSFGDIDRGLRALLVRGSVQYLRGEYAAGIATYEQVLQRAHLLVAPETIATAVHNVGNCHLGARDWARAREAYTDALARWDQLGVHTQQARACWSLATIAIACGEYDAGLQAFDDVRRQLMALGLTNDETLVRLEIAEILVLVGRGNEVSALLDGIAVNFASEGMVRNARLALAYVAETVDRNLVTAAELRSVRQYLERLPTHPKEVFIMQPQVSPPPS